MKYLFLQILNFLLFSICLASKSSLYSDSDPLWQLNSTNFHNTILKKNNAWIIEFYNNWCGHCIRFAPTWKQFAQEIRTWKNIIDVGVINCNDPQNLGLCRQYEVESYPTIKMFWHHTNDTSVGEVLKGKRDIFSMENKVIDFLDSHWEEGVPPEWPDIRPVLKETLQNLTTAMPKTRQSMMLYIEQPDTYTGRKVILDMSWQRNIIMRRILTTNQRLMKDLNFKGGNDTVPAVIRVFRNNFQLPLFKFTQNDTSTYIRDQIFEHIIGTARNKTKIEDFFPKQLSTTLDSNIDAVYMTDIENAVYYLLSQEIGVTKNIEGEKLSVVKSFLSILKHYFPGTPPVMSYLSNLHNWVIHKEHSISGEEFDQAMEQMQGEKEYLPKMREWVGCKGSEPRYRGYPCSLWTLFHTLTVQAHNVAESHDNTRASSGEVLFGIRNYVKNFFTCEECSTHFSEMAVNVESEVNNTQDAVLWLWEAHNKVNRRLSGDVTEDPKHPKIQFPSLDACPTCQTKDEASGDIRWNRDLVLKYLQRLYGLQYILSQDRIRVQVPFSADQNLSLNSSAMGIKFFSPLIQIFLCYCFTTFVSFCIYFEGSPKSDGHIS